jgi:hypothetical protein
LQRVGARRQRRIIVEPILEDKPAELPALILMGAQAAPGILPEIGREIGFGGALKTLQLSQFRGFFGGIIG